MSNSNQFLYTDLSGASFVSSNTHIYSDCSGQMYETSDRSVVPDSTPAVVEQTTHVTDAERQADLFCRMTHTNDIAAERPSLRPPPLNPVPNPAEEVSESESEEEEEEEEGDEEEEQLAPSTTLISRETLLYYSLRLIDLVLTVVSTTTHYAKKISTGVYNSFQPELYYFFRDSYVPWDARRVNLQSAGSPHVDWYYNAETHVFSREENDGRVRHFPYLTAEIYHGDLALYDITSFVEDLHWMGGYEDTAPSANYVLAAWYLSSGTLLDPALPLSLRVTNEEGESETILLHQTPTQ